MTKKLECIGCYRNIKAEMNRLGISQKTVAEYFDMSHTNLNAKINGRVPFSVPEIVEMRDVFMPDATLDYLLDFETTEAEKN